MSAVAAKRANTVKWIAALSKAHNPKAITLIMPTIASFISSGYEHSVANMYTFSLATLLNCNNNEKHGRYWLNLLLVTLGNIVGALIIAVAYWVAFIHGTDAEKEGEEPQPASPPLASEPTSAVAPPPRKDHPNSDGEHSDGDHH